MVDDTLTLEDVTWAEQHPGEMEKGNDASFAEQQQLARALGMTVRPAPGPHLECLYVVSAAAAKLWVRVGVVLPDGRRLKLAGHVIGGTPRVSRAALDEFLLDAGIRTVYSRRAGGPLRPRTAIALAFKVSA